MSHLGSRVALLRFCNTETISKQSLPQAGRKAKNVQK